MRKSFPKVKNSFKCQSLPLFPFLITQSPQEQWKPFYNLYIYFLWFLTSLKTIGMISIIWIGKRHKENKGSSGSGQEWSVPRQRCISENEGVWPFSESTLHPTQKQVFVMHLILGSRVLLLLDITNEKKIQAAMIGPSTFLSYPSEVNASQTILCIKICGHCKRSIFTFDTWVYLTRFNPSTVLSGCCFFP